METYPPSSAVPFLPSMEEPEQSEEQIRLFISDDWNVTHQECAQSVDVYSLSDYAKMFVADHEEIPTISRELATEFRNFSNSVKV